LIRVLSIPLDLLRAATTIFVWLNDFLLKMAYKRERERERERAKFGPFDDGACPGSI